MSFRGVVGVSLGDTGEFLIQKLEIYQFFSMTQKISGRKIGNSASYKREDRKRMAINMPHTHCKYSQL